MRGVLESCRTRGWVGKCKEQREGWVGKCKERREGWVGKCTERREGTGGAAVCMDPLPRMLTPGWDVPW